MAKGVGGQSRKHKRTEAEGVEKKAKKAKHTLQANAPSSALPSSRQGFQVPAGFEEWPAQPSFAGSGNVEHTELWLLQLPNDWDMTASGQIQLQASGDGKLQGSLHAAGQEFAVESGNALGAAQLYAAPVSGDDAQQAVPFKRRVTVRKLYASVFSETLPARPPTSLKQSKRKASKELEHIHDEPSASKKKKPKKDKEKKKQKKDKKADKP